MPGHELITLQLGNYANFVGAHFWNLQVCNACKTHVMSRTQERERLVAAQDELLGYTDNPEWQGYTGCVSTDVLYMTGEDRQVRSHEDLLFSPRLQQQTPAPPRVHLHRARPRTARVPS